MNILNAPNGTYLLPVALEHMHEQSRDWQSDVAFWKRETNFFDNLLVRNAHFVNTHHNRVELEHLQNKIYYYRGEVLDELQHNLKEHEKELKKLIISNGNDDETTYRAQHHNMQEAVRSFDKVYRELKHELFTFIEGLPHK